MSRKCCFEKVPGWWAQSSWYGLWIPLLSAANNRSCCTGYTYNDIRRIQGTFEEYNELLIDSINNLPRHSYLAKAQARYVKLKKESLGANEVMVLGDFAENYQYHPGRDTKLPLEQGVLHIASPSHLLQRCWWKPPKLFPLFHFRWQRTRHQFCSQDSGTTGGILEAKAPERHKDLLRFWWLWWAL